MLHILQPPPDLPPDLAELCLRVHLRFICFHFNVVQVYLCMRPECRGKAFMTQQLFVQHWIDSHTQRRYACLLCQRTKHEDIPETKENLLRPLDTSVSALGEFYFCFAKLSDYIFKIPSIRVFCNLTKSRSNPSLYFITVAFPA